jgi:hypothetical protein
VISSFWFNDKVVCYEGIIREVLGRPVYECRCDERLKTETEGCTRLVEKVVLDLVLELVVCFSAFFAFICNRVKKGEGHRVQNQRLFIINRESES